MKCQNTAYHFTESVATAKIKPEDGVTCESCHGPAKKYMGKTRMEDRQKAVAAGLVHPATASCPPCHNDQSPVFNGFDEKTYVERIAHPDPKVKRWHEVTNTTRLRSTLAPHTPPTGLTGR